MNAVDDDYAVRFVTIHGHRRAYRMCGQGPVILLLHGLGCDSTTWLAAMRVLSGRFTVVAPDLLGHGQSAKPRGDYSLGGYANGMRDLLTYLEIDRVTVVGHSFGGGIAMQFAYQFPERTERICLVAPGGLGPEVTPLIRLLTVPGAGIVLGSTARWPLRPAIAGSLRILSRTGLPYTRDLGEVAKVYLHLCDPGGRSAVRHVTGHVIDWRGQTVTMTDRAYLARLVPLSIMWGDSDHVIPSRHADIAAEHIDADVHVFENSGHFPHQDAPERFAWLLTEFVTTREAARYSRSRWRTELKRGARPELAAVV